MNYTNFNACQLMQTDTWMEVEYQLHIVIIQNVNQDQPVYLINMYYLI